MAALAFLTLFLVLNAQPAGSIAGWAVAVVWVVWKMLTRPGAISVPIDLGKLLVIPGLIILVALPGALFHPAADSGKDLWYLSNPILYVSFGYLLFEAVDSWSTFLQPFLAIGFVTSLYSVYNIASNRSLLLLSDSVESYRQIVGFGFGQAAIPIVLLLMMRRTGLPPGYIERHRWVRIVLYCAGSAAIVLSLSRTIILVLLSGVVLSLNLKTLRRKLLQRGGLPLLTLVIAAAAALYGAGSVRQGGFFLDKVRHTSSEIEVQHYDTFKEINDNWRGFEAYRALRTYDRFSPREKVMGGGLGTLVDLGFSMQFTSTESLRFLPVTHNGYAYLLVKTGVVGLVLFVLFLVQIFRLGWTNRRSADPVRAFAGLVLLWTAIDFAMTQGVITGIYNKSALGPGLLLLGALACSLHRQRRLQVAAGTALAMTEHELVTT